MKNEIQSVIIDDDKATLDIITTFLEGMKGFSIAFKTTDPEQGLDFIRRSDPDLLLTDVKMPKIIGLAITKELKKAK